MSIDWKIGLAALAPMVAIAIMGSIMADQLDQNVVDARELGHSTVVLELTRFLITNPAGWVLDTIGLLTAFGFINSRINTGGF
jgi:hypothetical protein